MAIESYLFPETPRVADLRRRVRTAMEAPAVSWDCPARIAADQMAKPLAVRKALATALKLAHMPLDLWDGQLIAGSMTLESPRVHAWRCCRTIRRPRPSTSGSAAPMG
jgi:hypothetical protein